MKIRIANIMLIAALAFASVAYAGGWNTSSHSSNTDTVLASVDAAAHHHHPHDSLDRDPVDTAVISGLDCDRDHEAPDCHATPCCFAETLTQPSGEGVPMAGPVLHQALSTRSSPFTPFIPERPPRQS